VELHLYSLICVHGVARDKFAITFKRLNTKDEEIVGLENKYELIVEV
jgi:hypothetical protein